MTKALVLLGHGDRASFNGELARRYVDGWRGAGGEASLVALGELSFDPVLRNGHTRDQPLEPDLLALRAQFEQADHVAWVFPTYWASPPAVVRAVVDRLFLPGWAFRYEGSALPTGLLAGRSSRVVSTMDSPGWWYALSYNRSLHGAFASATLRFVGFAPVKTTLIHKLRELDDAQRQRWLERVGTLAAQDLTHAAKPRRTPARQLKAKPSALPLTR